MCLVWFWAECRAVNNRGKNSSLVALALDRIDRGIRWIVPSAVGETMQVGCKWVRSVGGYFKQGGHFTTTGRESQRLLRIR